MTMADAKMHELNMQEGAGAQEAAAEAPAQNAAAEAPEQDSAPVMSAAVRRIYLALLIIMHRSTLRSDAAYIIRLVRRISSASMGRSASPMVGLS